MAFPSDLRRRDTVCSSVIATDCCCLLEYRENRTCIDYDEKVVTTRNRMRVDGRVLVLLTWLCPSKSSTTITLSKQTQYILHIAHSDGQDRLRRPGTQCPCGLPFHARPKRHAGAPLHRNGHAVEQVRRHASSMLDCVAIAVQRCTGMALRASVERETTRALGARAA